MPSVIDERPDFEIDVVSEGGVARVAVAGEVDLATAGELERALRAQLARQPVRLDLGGLRFMDSSGVRALAGVARDLEPNGWTLSILPELQVTVRQVLVLTGMIHVLPFETTEPGSSA